MASTWADRSGQVGRPLAARAAAEAAIGYRRAADTKGYLLHQDLHSTARQASLQAPVHDHVRKDLTS